MTLIYFAWKFQNQRTPTGQRNSVRKGGGGGLGFFFMYGNYYEMGN